MTACAIRLSYGSGLFRSPAVTNLCVFTVLHTMPNVAVWTDKPDIRARTGDVVFAGSMETQSKSQRARPVRQFTLAAVDRKIERKAFTVSVIDHGLAIVDGTTIETYLSTVAVNAVACADRRLVDLGFSTLAASEFVSHLQLPKFVDSGAKVQSNSRTFAKPPAMRPAARSTLHCG